MESESESHFLRHRHRQNEEQESSLAETSGAEVQGQEFATPEELIRHDAKFVSPPASIRKRLQRSAAGVPKPKRGWWQRLFGGDS